MHDSPSIPVSARPLTLDRLKLEHLRNLEPLLLEPAPRLNVISGNNGQGKTSVLEAIYLAATSRSFRTARLKELVRHGERIGSARARFTEHWPTGPVGRTQSVGLTGGRRTVTLDEESPPSLAHYATRSPVVIFDPQQLTLSMGPAAERRKLLDRVTLFTHPSVHAHRSRYGKALKERQRLLAIRHDVDQSSELDAYEALLAEHGAAMTRARREASSRLSASMARAFDAIAAPELSLEVRYEAGGADDVDEAQHHLRERRRADAASKRAGFGPHRDDLAFDIDGHPARVVASQGQHRAITLALKLAERDCIATARGVLPILLLDDVSSELDAERTEALFTHLASTQSQIFLTTTRRDLIVTTEAGPAERHDFTVSEGVVNLAFGAPEEAPVET